MTIILALTFVLALGLLAFKFRPTIDRVGGGSTMAHLLTHLEDVADELNTRLNGAPSIAAVQRAVVRRALDACVETLTAAHVPSNLVVRLGSDLFEQVRPFKGEIEREIADEIRRRADERATERHLRHKMPEAITVRLTLDHAESLDNFRVTLSRYAPTKDIRTQPSSVPRTRVMRTGPKVTFTLFVEGRRARLGDGVVIGTGPDCSLRVSDDTVSARHAEVVPADQGITVTDLSSTNGTYLNGTRLRPGAPVLVPTGASVELGGLRVLVEQDA